MAGRPKATPFAGAQGRASESDRLIAIAPPEVSDVLAKIVFVAAAGKDRADLDDLALSYLAALLHGGQICGEYFYAWSAGQLVAYAHVPRPQSWATRFHSQWSASALSDVTKAFGGPPTWTILEDNVPKRFPSWRRSLSLYLFTHAFHDESPVGCSDTGCPIPVYLLPISDQTREDLYGWACRYADHDHVYLDSAALEIAAYRQMADPASEMSVDGRQLCKDVRKGDGQADVLLLASLLGAQSGRGETPLPVLRPKMARFARQANAARLSREETILAIRLSLRPLPAGVAFGGLRRRSEIGTNRRVSRGSSNNQGEVATIRFGAAIALRAEHVADRRG